MKNKFKKYYISHHVIILKRFVIRLIRYLHNIKHFYICKTSFKYYLIKPGPMKSGLKGHIMAAHKKAHKKTHKKTHKKAHTMRHKTGHKNMT